jgi:hypothetical protein
MSKTLTWPAWFSAPDGSKSAVFETPEDVPNGWTSGAEKQSAGGKPAKAAKTSEKAPEPKKPEGGAANAELDAHGHAYDPALHAATKSKTSAGLWRMKVGVKRPAPAPGYPLDL